jgi:hypothetical protein
VTLGAAKVEWRAVVPDDDSDDHKSTRAAAMTTSNDVVPITQYRRPMDRKKTIGKGPTRTSRATLVTTAMQTMLPAPRDAAINSMASSNALVACNLLLLDAGGKVILV